MPAKKELGMTPMLEQALKRPLNYKDMSSREQWQVDKLLGILDWDPTDEEAEMYRKLRKKGGKKR